MLRFVTFCSWIGVLFCCVAPVAAQYEGVTRAAYDVELAFAITGRIQSLNVQPGDKVEAGQVIATLDDAAQQALVALAQEEATNDAAVRLAQQRLDHARTAAGDKADDDPAVREATLQLEQAQLQHTLAKHRLEHARRILAEHQLTAPVAGVIERVDAAAHQVVTPGQPVVRLIQPDKLLVDVAVPTQACQTLAVGGSAQVLPRRDNAQPLAGRILHIAHTIDSETDTRRVRIAIEAAGTLLVGDYVTVTFDTQAIATPPTSSHRLARTPATIHIMHGRGSTHAPGYDALTDSAAGNNLHVHP